MPNINKSNQAGYWDKIIDPKNIKDSEEVLFNLSEEMEYYRTPAQEYAYHLMGDLHGKRVLEIGCGLGVNSVILMEKGAKISAIDISLKRLETVQKVFQEYKIAGIQLYCASGESLPFQSNCFDIVYANAVMIHLDKDQTYSEIQRVLKPGGRVILVEPMKYHPLVNLYRWTLAPQAWKVIADYFISADFVRFGTYFQKTTHQEFFLFGFLAFFWEFGLRNMIIFRTKLKILNCIDQWLFKIIPGLSKIAWFTVYCGTKE